MKALYLLPLLLLCSSAHALVTCRDYAQMVKEGRISYELVPESCKPTVDNDKNYEVAKRCSFDTECQPNETCHKAQYEVHGVCVKK